MNPWFKHIALMMGLALYLLVSGLYAGATQGHVALYGQSESGYHVAELDVATVGIVPFAESRTIASGPNQHPGGGNSPHGSIAVLRTVQKGITSWMWQYALYQNDAPVHLRKEDLIYPFHYFW